MLVLAVYSILRGLVLRYFKLAAILYQSEPTRCRPIPI